MKNAVKGDIIYASSPDKFEIFEDGYLLFENDKIIGVTNEINDDYEVIDCSKKLIIPGFVDIHIHAPQINNIGLGADKELMDWLEIYTFPEEAKYKDVEFAKKPYQKFVNKLLNNGTTSSVVFGSIYNESTEYLMDLMDKTGLRAYVGKVNMDRNSPDFYIEKTQDSAKNTVKFVEDTIGKYKNIKPIITPRFVPSCTSELMTELGEIAKKYDLKIQSHLSENRREIKFVNELHPECNCYVDVYDKYGLLRDNLNTVMAHCVWTDEHEMQMLKSKQVMVAHSPYSNGNISSGISPVSKLLENGVNVGLSSDVSGGHEIFMGKVIVMASILSNMRWVHIDDTYPQLKFEQLFYMATKGGGKFFGDVGSFEKGYKADFLVIDDDSLSDSNNRTVRERLQRFLYIGDDRNIQSVYVDGKKIK